MILIDEDFPLKVVSTRNPGSVEYPNVLSVVVRDIAGAPLAMEVVQFTAMRDAEHDLAAKDLMDRALRQVRRVKATPEQRAAYAVWSAFYGMGGRS